MRGWLGAFDQIVPLFEEVEIWSTQCSIADHPQVKWVPFWAVKPWSLQAIVFHWQLQFRISQQEVWPPPETVVQITGFKIAQADIRFIHYSNVLFQEEVHQRPETLSPKWYRKLSLQSSVNEERKVLAQGRTGHWWAVSRRLGERVQGMDQSQGQLYLTPNSYDPDRFNPASRLRNRVAARERYGFAEGEQVLVFSAYAHFERKGLLQAVAAVAQVRRAGVPLRLLVLGGTPRVLADFQEKMAKEKIEPEGIVFAGLVSEIETHLAAADGLIFPSHFEAFSLAEIEAAAMGLRLYLTAHYGIEMILKDPVNGRLLPWDVAGMAKVLQEECESEALGTFHKELGEALTPDDYSQRLVTGYRQVLVEKEQGRKG